MLARAKPIERIIRNCSVQFFVKVYDQADDDMAFEKNETKAVAKSRDLDDGSLLLSADQLGQGFEGSGKDLSGDVVNKSDITNNDMGFQTPEVFRRPICSDGSGSGLKDAKTHASVNGDVTLGSDEESGGDQDSDDESDEDEDDDIAPLQRCTQGWKAGASGRKLKENYVDNNKWNQSVGRAPHHDSREGGT